MTLDYSDPPVVEVSLAVQFEQLANFRSVHTGLFWAREDLRSRFPQVEEHSPIDEQVEEEHPVSEPEVRVQLLKDPPLPRFLLLNSDRTELLQLQNNRFSHNWKKTKPGDQYVRFSRMRPTLESELGSFGRFLESEKLGKLRITQCEIAYVNHIDAGAGSYGNPLQFFKLFDPSFGMTGLETASVMSSHAMRTNTGKFLGRMHLSIRPAMRTTDKQPIYVLQLTARGAPIGEGIAGAMRFLELGHELLAQLFANVTSLEVQKKWGRSDV